MGFLNNGKLIKNIIRSYCETGTLIAMKYLNVAEKNDAAKNIAAILSNGNSRRREGLSNYNKIYEFETTVRGQTSQMIMTSVSGHLLNYEFVSTYRAWQSCNPIALFDAPVIKSCPENYQKIKKTLEREIKYCQGLIIWTDCDREGENIGFEIIKVCKDVKPNINIYRAKFSEITRQSIQRALNNLEQPNKNISDAVDVRQEIDLRTGAAFTRLQTLRFQKVFPQKLSEKLISYGSCQFPTLGFVVERYQAIEDFVAESFWKIKMMHHIEELKIEFLWKRERLFDKDACAAILDICKDDPTATIELVESKPKSKWRPLPLDTVEMEKSISKKLRINAKETMKIAERLYTQGLISYPRTETNIFPKELNLTPLVEQQTNDNQWGQFAQRILNDGGPNPRQGRKTDQAHPPIHPTKYVNNLNGDEKKVYEFIVRHFLACVSKDAVGHETIVHADISDEKFVAKGLMILERNYLDVYIYEKWNAKEIYYYREGDTFTPTVLEMVEGSTTPPKLLTEAELIAIMEKHGIGTDATHAEHIDTIKAREYVGLHENIYFIPGTLGMGLVEGYNNIGLEISLAKPTLRADFENDLKLICEGRKDHEIVRREQVEKYKEVFKKVIDKLTQLDQSLANRLQHQPQQINQDNLFNNNEYKPVLKCPKCNNDMVLRDRKNNQGKFLSCVGYPACKNSIWFTSNIETVDVLDRSCTTCGPNVKKLKFKFKQNPFPGEPNPNELCIGGCDTVVLENLDISIASVQNVNNSPNTSRANQSTLNSYIQRNDQNRSTSNITHVSTNTSNIPERTNNRANSNPMQSQASSSSNNRSNGALLLVPSSSSTNRFNTNDNDRTNNDNTIVCTCNMPGLLLTVRKEGPNKGRKFYKCSENVCNFFLWAPDDDGPSTSTSTNNNANSDTIVCNCNEEAALKTVQKEGPNKGRKFYCCPKPMGQGCSFFKWADDATSSFTTNNDDDDPPGGGSSGRRPNNSKNWKNKSKKSSNTKTMPYQSQTRAKRKCGKCGQEGHNRKNCPN